MSEVAIVDTSVLLNVLDVPGFNQDRVALLREFRSLIDKGTNMLLPMAAVFAAGNHIAQLRDGGSRRRDAQRFSDQVREALDGVAPWQPMRFPTVEDVGTWIDGFPESAMCGLGIADLSIVKEWEAAVARHPLLRVYIWSLDRNLMGYDRRP